MFNMQNDNRMRDSYAVLIPSNYFHASQLQGPPIFWGATIRELKIKHLMSLT